MALQRPSLVRRLLKLLFFRLVPLALVLGIAWNGWGVAQAVSRHINEQNRFEQAQQVFPDTATAIAANFVVPTNTATNTASATFTSIASPSQTPTAFPTLTASAAASHTPSPTETLTPSPTSTFTQSPAPVQASATEAEPGGADRNASLVSPSVEAIVVAQFATNTPVSGPGPDFAFATNTPLGQSDVATPTTVATTVPNQVPSATNTTEPTMTPPAIPTPTVVPVISVTPPPLPTVLFLGDPDPNQVDVTAIPTRVEPLPRNGYDLVNILLLGSDGEITGDGFRRTDTMIVLSINRTTGTVAMLSLPRDLFVYIPAWGMQRLNLAWARGESGGWVDGPFELIRQTILYNFGINVHYYALIDLTGFKEAIDLVGGVDVDVDCAIEDLPLIGAEVPAAARRVNDEGYYVLDVGEYHLSGAEALWYARSRHSGDDFDRGRRQQQILRAVWRKALDTNQIASNLANIPELWNTASQLVETNLRFEDIIGLVPFGLNLQPSMIENFALTRTYHTTPWQPPNGEYVQLPVYDTMRPLLEDFYQPPTESRILLEGARIRVMNGTTNSNWDRVAASRLGWDGLNAFAAGQADRTDYADTVLIDYSGQTKGSSLNQIAKILNVRPENIKVEPDANREVDFDVILGSKYNSCTFPVLPVDG